MPFSSILVIGVSICQPLAEPARLPGVDAVVDSLGLLGKLAAVDAVPAGETILSIQLSERPRGHIVGDSTPSPVHEAVLSHVLASLRPAAKNSPLAFRLQVRSGSVVTISLDRSILCAPEALEGDVRGRAVVGSVSSRVRPSEMRVDPRPVMAKLRINSSGAVVAVTMVSSSGFDEIDRAYREDMRARRYRPALLDGRPVEVWLTDTKAELVR